jgi:hypothetical protein
VAPVKLSLANVPAGTLTARLELDSDRVAPRGRITGNLVIENRTGHRVDLWEKGKRCTPDWGVFITSVTLDSAFGPNRPCYRKPIVVPPGTTRRGFALLAYDGNTPLPAGRYALRFVSRTPIADFTPPAPVDVTVVAPRAGAALTSRIVLDDDTVKTGAKVTGNLVIENTTGSSVDLWERSKLRCSPRWLVVVTSNGVPIGDFAWSMECGSKPLTVEPGTTRLPFTAWSEKPLTVGDYAVRFTTRAGIEGLVDPKPVSFTVAP